MKKTVFSLFFLALSAFAQTPSSTPKAQAACGPATQQFQIRIDESQGPEPQVESGKALVYVAEDQRFKHVKDDTVRIGLDGTWAGAARGSSYLFFSVEPGEHHLCVDWLAGSAGRVLSFFALKAEPGRIYYFRARATGGPTDSLGRSALDYGAAIDLDLVNEDEGKFLVSSLPHVLSQPKK